MKTPAIIWTIDPFQDNPKIWNQSQEMAKNVTRSFRCVLQPVFVADRGLLPGTGKSSPQDIPAEIERSQLQLKKLLKPLHSKKILKPRVLFLDAYNTDDEVRFLEDCTVQSETPLVIASTNARKGMRRFLDGSFSETLVKYSKAPVLLVNPKCQISRSLKKILFATDFSRQSHKALKKVCETARYCGAELEIITVLTDPLYWSDMGAPMAMGTQSYIHTDFFKQDVRNAKRKGAAMLRAAKAQGIDATFHLDENPNRSVSDAICKQAIARKADMIAIAARGDTSKMHFFGSTAQSLMRNSARPIWIYHEAP